MRRCIAVLLGLAAIGCAADSTSPGTPPPPTPTPGPLALTIVAGQGQTAVAGDSQLGQRIVAQLVRSSATNQAGAAATPVRGATLCADSSAPVHALRAATRCTTTDSAGRAALVFTPPTVVGAATATLSATFGQEPTVHATATASVTAGPIDTLQLGAHTLVLFVGQAASLETMPIHAADRFGNTITSPPLTMIAPDGWRIVNDVLQPPDSGEAEGPVVFASAAARDTLLVSAVVNLRPHIWHANWACFYDGTGPVDGQGVALDSTTFAAVIDSFAYASPAAQLAHPEQAPLTIGYHAETVDYRVDGLHEIRPDPVRAVVAIPRVAPDSLILSTLGASPIVAAIRTSSSDSLTYDGSGFDCAVGPGRYRPLHLVADPPPPPPPVRPPALAYAINLDIGLDTVANRVWMPADVSNIAAIRSYQVYGVQRIPTDPDIPRTAGANGYQDVVHRHNLGAGVRYTWTYYAVAPNGQESELGTAPVVTDMPPMTTVLPSPTFTIGNFRSTDQAFTCTLTPAPGMPARTTYSSEESIDGGPYSPYFQMWLGMNDCWVNQPQPGSPSITVRVRVRAHASPYVDSEWVYSNTLTIPPWDGSGH